MNGMILRYRNLERPKYWLGPSYVRHHYDM
jgi:hypothetical protein